MDYGAVIAAAGGAGRVNTEMAQQREAALSYSVPGPVVSARSGGFNRMLSLTPGLQVCSSASPVAP